MDRRFVSRVHVNRVQGGGDREWTGGAWLTCGIDGSASRVADVCAILALPIQRRERRFGLGPQNREGERDRGQRHRDEGGRLAGGTEQTTGVRWRRLCRWRPCLETVAE